MEQRLHDLFFQNLIKGTSHLAIGQEAIASGCAADASRRLYILHLSRPRPHQGQRRIHGEDHR